MNKTYPEIDIDLSRKFGQEMYRLKQCNKGLSCDVPLLSAVRPLDLDGITAYARWAYFLRFSPGADRLYVFELYDSNGRGGFSYGRGGSRDLFSEYSRNVTNKEKLPNIRQLTFPNAMLHPTCIELKNRGGFSLDLITDIFSQGIFRFFGLNFPRDDHGAHGGIPCWSSQNSDSKTNTVQAMIEHVSSKIVKTTKESDAVLTHVYKQDQDQFLLAESLIQKSKQ